MKKKRSRKDLTIAASFDINPSAHKEKQKKQKLYNKGAGSTNPNEKEIFLKRTGPQLPLAKTKKKNRNRYA